MVISLTGLLFSLLDTKVVAVQAHSKAASMTHPVKIKDGRRADIAHLSHALHSSFVSYRNYEKTEQNRRLLLGLP